MLKSLFRWDRLRYVGAGPIVGLHTHGGRGQVEPETSGIPPITSSSSTRAGKLDFFMPLSLNEFIASIDSKKSDSDHALPPLEAIAHAEASLPVSLPDIGMGLEDLKQHLLDDLVPGFNRPNQSSNYYGFIIGGNTDAALFADYIVSGFDQNVQVHAPREAVGSSIESAALK